MDITQKTYLNVEKNGKMIQLVVESYTPLRAIIEALTEFKGFYAEKILSSRKEEQEKAERQEQYKESTEVTEYREKNGSKSRL